MLCNIIETKAHCLGMEVRHMPSKHETKSTNKVYKLLHKILASLKIVYEIVKVLKSICDLFHR